jgi:D-beta-D-heptose 7-phosphate kinase/D-beta-D-heptose 1-phosphate adenosyltransferase
VRHAISGILTKAQDTHVVCIGDLMLDRYVYGSVSRVSPEAPVPVLRKARTVEMPGGAGNVARNLAALGVKTTMLGCVGDDEAGRTVEALMRAHGLIDSKLVTASSLQTVVKSRFVASNQQLLRVDTEDSPPDIGAAGAVLAAAVEKLSGDASAIIVSDYAKGCITPLVFQACVRAAKAAGIPLLVDPKSEDLSDYAGASLVKPNAGELAAATGLATDTDQEIETALQACERTLPGSQIVVTRAGKGMSWLSGSELAHVHGRARQVFDVSGAGDTSMAALATGLATGAELKDAVDLAVIASGLVVGKTGTATIDQEEILRAIAGGAGGASSQVLGRNAIADQVRLWKSERLRVGFTNGCFDILHPGHLSVLEEARSKCDRLVVAINTDASVARLKGQNRPVNTEADRANLLAGLSAVDAVTAFDEDTPQALVDLLVPDLLVKGGDYRPEDVVGADTVRANGGEVLIVPLLQGKSTTSIIARSTR